MAGMPQVLPPAEKKVVYKTVAALEGNGLEEEQVTALLAVLGQNQDEKTVLEIQTHTWHPDPKRQATQLKLVAQRLLGSRGATGSNAGAGAAGPISDTAAVGTLTVQQLRQVVQETIQQNEEQKEKGVKRFSSAAATDAVDLLEYLQVQEVDGNELYPIQLPKECPVCDSFDYSQYAKEDDGTPALLQHHQRELQKHGVQFGRNHYTMYDLHNDSPLYSIATAKTVYRGRIDGCVGPHGLLPASATRQCRVGYGHKQSPAQKQAYRARHPEVPPLKDAGSGSVSFSAGYKGQAVTATIGAYAHNSFPLIMDLTDGEVHHLLQLRPREGENEHVTELREWLDLTPTEAYYKQAELLNEYHLLLTKRTLPLEDIPEEFQAPLKKIQTLRPASGLAEQLDSITSGIDGDGERFEASLELMQEWGRCGLLEMPTAVRAMYG